MTDPQTQQDWKTNESVAHDFVMMAEHELAEANNNTAYHRATVAEMDADLGDKAQKYLEILTAIEWVDEDWEKEYLDDESFDTSAPLPF